MYFYIKDIFLICEDKMLYIKRKEIFLLKFSLSEFPCA